MLAVALGLRSKLTALFLLLALGPLSLAGWLFYRTASGTLVQRSEDHLIALAQVTADQVEAFFRERRASLELLAETPFIQLAFLAHEFNQSLHEVREKLYAYQKKEPFYHRITLYDLKGARIVSFPEPDRVAPGPPIWFRGALGRDYYASDLGLTEGRPSVVLAKTVYDFDRPGHPVGLLVFDLDFGAVAALLEKVRPARSAAAFLLDGRGVVFAHPEPSSLGRPWVDDERDPSLVALGQRMLVGDPGFGSHREGDQERFVAFAPVPKKGWIVGVSIERNDLLADVLAFRRRMLTLGLVTLAVGMIAALGVVQWLVTPLNALTRGAAAIARGEWDQTISISRGDEIGQLASTFNRMARALSETTAHLIQRERLAALGELAAAIAHEVRNPLAGLKTSLQVLARRLGDHDARSFGADVQKEVDRLNALVSSLLDYARPARAKPVSVPIPTILDQALPLVKKSLDQHGIRLVQEIGTPAPRAFADPQQMGQVFLNLFLNAQKAMPGGGTLTVACRTVPDGDDRRVEVIVADTGKGIPEEILPRIFDPFFTTDPQGTGLGLAIAHRLIRENGGSIRVESPPQGGAIFVVRLPAAPHLFSSTQRGES